jgi:site-specific recombinase XerD
MEAGVDLRVIQMLMRHQNLATTEIYTYVNDRRRAEGIDRLNPFGMSAAA